MAYGEATNSAQVPNAFQAAEFFGGTFKLFFSFDYAGNGAWPKADVTKMIQQYSGKSTYYTYNGKPFVSTFEGPGNSADWKDIKAATGSCKLECNQDCEA